MDEYQKYVQDWSQESEFTAIRAVKESTSWRQYRNGKPLTNTQFIESGAMVEVMVDGHMGYAGSADTSPQGLRRLFLKAKDLAKSHSSKKIFKFTGEIRPPTKGYYISPSQKPFDSMTIAAINSILRDASLKLQVSDKVVSGTARIMQVETEIGYFSSSGAAQVQKFQSIGSNFRATAAEGSMTQSRSDNGLLARFHQSGLEFLTDDALTERCIRIGTEAVELLGAEECPSGVFDLLLMPDQMMLQIHESIGHPLELDRILGDERNYAGWSFVKPSDFGRLQYGSPLMNCTFDPTVAGEYASYSFDDGGAKSSREFLIKDGVLLRGLGGKESTMRSGLPGVSNFRSASWNRAPIDRMANINLEPGTSSFNEMIGSVEKGVLMEANVSWSIDDYRNKFQFGCEYGKLIEGGKLTKTVKNPNYRSSTIEFWNRLKMVGDSSTLGTFGTPFCGKGEPNQIIRVGHRSPACLFNQVEIFGGNA